jgi:hypothetical protein
MSRSLDGPWFVSGAEAGGRTRTRLPSTVFESVSGGPWLSAGVRIVRRGRSSGARSYARVHASSCQIDCRRAPKSKRGCASFRRDGRRAIRASPNDPGIVPAPARDLYGGHPSPLQSPRRSVLNPFQGAEDRRIVDAVIARRATARNQRAAGGVLPVPSPLGLVVGAHTTRVVL